MHRPTVTVLPPPTPAALVALRFRVVGRRRGTSWMLVKHIIFLGAAANDVVVDGGTGPSVALPLQDAPSARRHEAVAVPAL